MATALYCYSLVPRDQARRGATKAELLASVFTPNTQFQAAEEVFNLLTADDEGLGALDTPTIAEGGAVARYRLSVSQTPQMFYRQAKATVTPEERDAFLWERAKGLIVQGPFDATLPVSRPDAVGEMLGRVFADVDQNSKTRLVILDPRCWTLLNGRDTPTRSDIESLLGVGAEPLPVDNAASCVVACVNTQRREDARKRATDYLAWRSVVGQLEGDEDRRAEAQGHLRDSAARLDRETRRAFQHFAYLVRGADRIDVEWKRFDDDNSSSLHGNQVWVALTAAGRATAASGVSGVYLGTLLERIRRDLTLKEIVQQFFKNPVFPLVRSLDEVRRAIYELTELGWAVVGPDSKPLDIRGPSELSIGSLDQTLRKGGPTPEPGPEPGAQESADHGDAGPTERPALGSPHEPSSYRRGIVRMANQSVVNPEARQRATDLLWTLYDTLEPVKKHDVQLLDVTVTLTADAAALDNIKAAVEKTGAQWREEDVDF
jgi:hypothetical protein